MLPPRISGRDPYFCFLEEKDHKESPSIVLGMLATAIENVAFYFHRRHGMLVRTKPFAESYRSPESQVDFDFDWHEFVVSPYIEDETHQRFDSVVE
jgi:hypothetical protein